MCDDVEKKKEQYKKDYEFMIKKYMENHQNYIKVFCNEDDAKETQMRKNSEQRTFALMEAEKLWLVVQLSWLDPEFAKISDAEKMDMCRNFVEFHKSFPIVTKYMVCLQQFDRGAFDKFLVLCETELMQTGRDDRPHMEKRWIHCQAQYVRFLWEAQMINFSIAESDEIYQKAHDMIEAEFELFRRQHEQAEKKISKEKTKYQIELTKELVDQVGRKKNDEMAKVLISRLQDIKFRQTFDQVVAALRKNTKYIYPCIIGEGQNIEALAAHEQEAKQQRIKKNWRAIEPAA